MTVQVEPLICREQEPEEAESSEAEAADAPAEDSAPDIPPAETGGTQGGSHKENES